MCIMSCGFGVQVLPEVTLPLLTYDWELGIRLYGRYSSSCQLPTQDPRAVDSVVLRSENHLEAPQDSVNAKSLAR